ncbi:MAG: helix-turn-helix domain-containing protein [bacterium]
MPEYYQLRLIRMRLAWIYLYEQGNNISHVCRHFGIARKTFYKWYKRFMPSNRDPQSLKDRSRKPKNSSAKTKEL